MFEAKKLKSLLSALVAALMFLGFNQALLAGDPTALNKGIERGVAGGTNKGSAQGARRGAMQPSAIDVQPAMKSKQAAEGAATQNLPGQTSKDAQRRFDDAVKGQVPDQVQKGVTKPLPEY